MAGRTIGLSEEEDAAREEALQYVEANAPAETEDFDAFWSAQDRKPTTLRNVFGVDVTLPPSLPLRFEVEARKVQDSKGEDDTKRMVAILFGDDAMDTWTERGMDIEQFAVLLMWGTSNTRTPGSMTLTEAREIIATRTASLGKETPDPATTSGGASAATGRRSKQTSSASTGSRKKR